MVRYSAKFSGHQTFPLRYGWLYKYSSESTPNNKGVEDLMVSWGVGKNMVEGIRYWAAEVIDRDRDIIEYDHIHEADSYLESVSSVWLLHWLLCRNYRSLTAYRVFFNFFNGQRFTRESLVEFIDSLFQREKFLSDTKSQKLLSIPNASTLKKDVGVFAQMYAPNISAQAEDGFSSPLSELGLVSNLGRSDFVSELGGQPSLTSEVFCYALIDYLYSSSVISGSVRTVSFDQLLTAPGSPARIFRLSQSALERRLDEVATLTGHRIDWTDTAGLRQLQIKEVEVLNLDSRQALLYAALGVANDA